MAQSAQAKSVLITGGTDGLGKAAALLFAERNYRVFLKRLVSDSALEAIFRRRYDVSRES